MVDIELYSDEIVILNDESGSLNDKGGELFLTNRRIIWVKKTVFGNKIKDQKEIPLSSIKIYNGSPQVSITGDRQFPKVQIQHTSGIDSLDFDSRKEATLWLNEIHKTITGEEAGEEADKLGSFSIPGMDLLGKGIKDSVGAFASGLGIMDKVKKEARISTNCNKCGAPLSGTKGEKATCEYCGTVQILR